MGANNRSLKDKTMAAYLKKMGIQRTTQRCPMCGNPSVANIQNHLNVCKGFRH